MIFFGWGKKSRTWTVGEDRQLVATWSYVHLFWCPIAGPVSWTLQGHDRREDKKLSKDDVKRLLMAKPPSIGSWQRFGLLYVIAGILLIDLIR